MKKEEIENKIEKLRLEISDEEIKLKYINEVGIDNFDENQFKVYKVLQTIKSDFYKSDLIIKPTEPSKYPKELVDLWDELTKNIVVEHRDGNIFFYDTIKNEVIMEDRKSCLWCRYKGFWSDFKNNFDLQYANIQEFIQYMVWDTFKLRVNKPYNHDRDSITQVWDTFKLSTLKTQINQK